MTPTTTKKKTPMTSVSEPTMKGEFKLFSYAGVLITAGVVSSIAVVSLGFTPTVAVGCVLVAVSAGVANSLFNTPRR